MTSWSLDVSIYLQLAMAATAPKLSQSKPTAESGPRSHDGTLPGQSNALLIPASHQQVQSRRLLGASCTPIIV